MIGRFAEGDNYAIEIRRGVAVCRVWSRPDLDSAAGAQLAQDKVAHFRRLVAGHADGLILDLSAAPTVTGPKTQQALGEMLRIWQDARKPIALVVGRNAMQQLQLRRLIATFAAKDGILLDSVEEAQTWIETRLDRP
jgi:hypothetical protein